MALHVADLDDGAGLVAGRDDRVRLRRSVAERLLAKDVPPQGKGLQGLIGMGEVRRGDEHRVERFGMKRVAVGEGRDAEVAGDEVTTGGRGIGNTDEMEAVGEPQEIRDMLPLGDQPGADNADADAPGHQATPSRVSTAKPASRAMRSRLSYPILA